jgi:hypothetical protein
MPIPELEPMYSVSEEHSYRALTYQAVSEYG